MSWLVDQGALERAGTSVLGDVELLVAARPHRGTCPPGATSWPRASGCCRPAVARMFHRRPNRSPPRQDRISCLVSLYDRTLSSQAQGDLASSWS
jgi:hypothetical protein